MLTDKKIVSVHLLIKYECAFVGLLPECKEMKGIGVVIQEIILHIDDVYGKI